MIQIDKKENCTGCFACQSICPQTCITMEPDAEGFRYPVVDTDKCINCELCVKVCPIIHKTVVDNLPVAYACISKNEETRLASSSGGMFSLLAEHVLDMNSVVFGAAFDNEFHIEHKGIEIRDDLHLLRGSKYVQSKIGDTYMLAKSSLDQGRAVLFSGTPCQIGGLKSYLGKPYDKLLCVDIVCHGVPSPKVWEKYVHYRENVAQSHVQKINFRNKCSGWKQYSVTFLFENREEYRQTQDKDLFMRAFLKDICLRPSCYECKFKGLHRQSDMTLADFWGVQHISPQMDDDKGTSLVFVNSSKGAETFKSIGANLTMSEVSIDQAIQYNTAAIRSAPHNPNRAKFFRNIEKREFDQLVNKYCSSGVYIRVKNKAKSVIKRALGM